MTNKGRQPLLFQYPKDHPAWHLDLLNSTGHTGFQRIPHVDQHQLLGDFVISSMALKEARESSRPFSSAQNWRVEGCEDSESSAKCKSSWS